ncbi:MAG TPA: HK97-gp10 family putative phage morphogenesis protein [Candidatus Sulfotelmatobacter sp.]
MPDAITIQVDGLDELGRALESIPAVLATRVMRGALHAAGDVMAEAIELTAPVRSGALKADIITKVRVGSDLSDNYVIVGPGYERGALTVKGVTRNKRGGIEAVVDTTESPGVYAAFVERGHRPPGHGVRNDRAGKHSHAHELEFGGASTPPHPFMRPAFDSSKEAALDTFVEYVRAGLNGVIEAVRNQS